MSVPQSRRRSNRQRGVLSKQMRASLADSTYGRSKRSPIDTLKPNAPFNAATSFLSQSPCDEIFNELVLALKCEADLDVDIHRNCYKIRGRKFLQNQMCEFQIELFRTTSAHQSFPDHIVVEFQRRNGDGFVFQRFMESMFCELRKTKIIAHSEFPAAAPSTHSAAKSPHALSPGHDAEEKQNHSELFGQHGHCDTLRVLLSALFDRSSESELRRTAANYLAGNVADNLLLVDRIVEFEPLIISKFSDLLLRSMDPQIVRSVGIALFYMMEQSETVRREALRLNLKTVCKKTLKRWTEPVEQRYGKNDKFVIRVIPSLQVAQRMSACIEVLE